MKAAQNLRCLLSLSVFVIGYSPVQLPQAISRCEASYHCPKDNTTRRQANRTEAHFLAKCASSDVRFSPDQARTRAGSRDAIKKASAIFSKSGMMKGNTHFVSASRKVMVPLPT